MSSCIFCDIAQGKSPCHQIYQDKNHLAFLSIFPNTEAFSIVITKKHYSSYFAHLPSDVLDGLVQASAKVAKLIDQAFPDVGRTGLIFEGFGVDHIHAKLFPMHGTSSHNWQQHLSSVDKFFHQYQGYISSHNGPRMDDKILSQIDLYIE